MTATDTISAWAGLLPSPAIVEFMGHRKLAGHLTKLEGRFFRLDVYGTDDTVGDPIATQVYSDQAIYCITVCDEATARRAAGLNRVTPVTRWELPAAPAPPAPPAVPPHDPDGHSEPDPDEDLDDDDEDGDLFRPDR